MSSQAQEDCLPTIGIVIPNFNDGRFLVECLKSVLSQRDPPDELIVIDDGSTDDSRDLIEATLRTISYARVFFNERNLGATETSNRGLSLATADYLIFLAANDVVAPDLVQETRLFYRKHPNAGMCSALMELMDEGGKRLGFFKSPMLSLETGYIPPARARGLLESVGTWTTAATVSYPRKRLLEIGGFDPAMKGFSDLLVPAILAGRYGVGFIPKVLCSLRMHKGNFLSSTLANSAGMEALVRHFVDVAPRLAPELFTPSVLGRFCDRIYFAMFRITPTGVSPYLAASLGRWRTWFLRLICRWIPPSLQRLRVLAGFAVIRGRDLLPFIYRRLILGWYWSLRNSGTSTRHA